MKDNSLQQQQSRGVSLLKWLYTHFGRRTTWCNRTSTPTTQSYLQKRLATWWTNVCKSQIWNFSLIKPFCRGSQSKYRLLIDFPLSPGWTTSNSKLKNTNLCIEPKNPGMIHIKTSRQRCNYNLKKPKDFRANKKWYLLKFKYDSELRGRWGGKGRNWGTHKKTKTSAVIDLNLVCSKIKGYNQGSSRFNN